MMTSGMIARFKALASRKNEHLLRVKLSKERDIYGYVREVGADYFIFQEVRKDARGKAKETSKMIRNLGLVVEFGEITVDKLPAPFPMFGVA